MNEHLVSCPLDPVHRIGEKRLSIHINNCKKNFPHMRECPFNTNHWVHKEQLDDHIMNCPNKSILDSYLISKAKDSAPVDNHDRSETSIIYNENVADKKEVKIKEDSEEEEGEWDRETNNPNNVVFVPKTAIFPKTQGLQPSERKSLYQELFRDENNTLPLPKPVVHPSDRSSYNASPAVNATTFQQPQMPIFGLDDFPSLSSAPIAKNKEDVTKTKPFSWPTLNSSDTQQLPFGLEEFPALSMNSNPFPSEPSRQPTQASQSSLANNSVRLTGIGRGRMKNTLDQPEKEVKSHSGIERSAGYGRGLQKK